MNENILNLIRKILEKNLDKNKYKFFIYGSRARWDYNLRSDYDIGILWDKKINFILKEKIKYELDEKVPALIDLTDFNNVSDFFKEKAMEELIYF